MKTGITIEQLEANIEKLRLASKQFISLNQDMSNCGKQLSRASFSCKELADALNAFHKIKIPK